VQEGGCLLTESDLLRRAVAYLQLQCPAGKYRYGSFTKRNLFMFVAAQRGTSTGWIKLTG
jgi:hypothetical protein